MGRLIKLTVLVSCIAILGEYLKMGAIEFVVSAASDFSAGLSGQSAELRYTPHRQETGR